MTNKPQSSPTPAADGVKLTELDYDYPADNRFEDWPMPESQPTPSASASLEKSIRDSASLIYFADEWTQEDIEEELRETIALATASLRTELDEANKAAAEQANLADKLAGELAELRKKIREQA